MIEGEGLRGAGSKMLDLWVWPAPKLKPIRQEAAK
jgi:hypothetical protein